jgi:hypothetical protein
MRYTAVLLAAATIASTVLAPHAEAQTRRNRGDPLFLTVRPRSFLNPGTVVEVGSLNRTTSGYAQTQSFILSPPYAPSMMHAGRGVLPDPVLNGPYVGATNPFGPINYVAPPGLAR